MKAKSILIIATAVTLATLLFAACNKQNEHTGLHVFVTDEHGNTVLDANGVPKTEEWKTSIVYATDENGETYTNANGDKVTVKQTRPSITQIIEVTDFSVGEDGKPVKGADGKYIYAPVTKVVNVEVTDKNGNRVTQEVTDANGEPVLNANGQPASEVVTETVTEKVTNYIELTPDGTQKYYNVSEKTTKTKTTSIYDNPLYTEGKTKKPTKPAQTAPKAEKHVASNSWLQNLDAPANDTFADVEAIDSNSYVVLGNTESKDGAFATIYQKGYGYYSFVAKYNKHGEQAWICPIGYKGHTKIHDIAVLEDGSIIAVGEIAVLTNGEKIEDLTEKIKSEIGFTPDSAYEAIIAKISADGQLLWIKNYGGSATEYFTCVTETPDGGFVAAGRFKAADGTFASLGLKTITPVFAKFDANGNVIWFDAFRGSGADAVNAIASDAQGNIYGACQIVSSDLDGKGNHGSADIGIIKFSADGAKLWTRMIGGSKSDVVNDIYAGASGCIFAGSYISNDGDFTLNRGGKDAFIGFCDVDGNVKWLRTFGGIGSDTFNQIVSTSFGYACAGLSDSANRDLATIGNHGEYDGFIMSINTAGNLEHVKSFAGSANDSVKAICKLDSKTYIAVGETYSKDKDFSLFDTQKCSAVMGMYYIY